MSDRKQVATVEMRGTYGADFVKVERMTRGRFAGKFFTRGGGYAGRVAYSSVERVRAVMARDARFVAFVEA